MGIAILHFCAKNQKKLISWSRESLISLKMVKGNFPKYENPYFTANKHFPGKITWAIFYRTLPSIFLPKIRENQWSNFAQSPKNPIFRQFLAQICPNIFFSKIGLRYILGIAILHHCAKNLKKIMSQHWEKLYFLIWLKGISPKYENPFFKANKNFPGKTTSAIL